MNGSGIQFANGPGIASFGDIAALRKALTAGQDISNMTGGGALRIQSLEKTLLSTIQDNSHFRLFNKLEKDDATATVDEWTEQSGVGGFPGGSFNGEVSPIAAATGDYTRRYGVVKFLMTLRQVSFVQSLQNTIVESQAVEQANGALQLLTDAEHAFFEGDADVVPEEFDGINKQIVGLGSTDHVIDMQAKPLYSIEPFNNAAATIAGDGNFGTPTDVYLSYQTQADLDTNLDPAFRVPLDNSPNSIMLGTTVRGIRTAHGDIANNPDVFIRDEKKQYPFEVNYSAIAAANNYAPASVTVATATDASSMFTTPTSGNYYWAVAGITKAGQSVVTKTAQTAVAAGNKATLTISASAAGTETGYVIYRSRLNGTNDTTDFRFVARIAKAGATTTWVDENREIPGTTKAFMLNQRTGAKAITWRPLLPMVKFDLYPTNSMVVPWAQAMFGYLRIGKRNQHVVFKNILPNGATWRPFG